MKLTNKQVSIYADANMQGKVAQHAAQEPGRFSRILGSGGHRDPLPAVPSNLEKRIGVHIGPHALCWAENIVRKRSFAAIRTLQGLLQLGQKHGAAAVETACQEAASRGRWNYADIRSLIGSTHSQPSLPNFEQSSSVIRPLQQYGDFISRNH